MPYALVSDITNAGNGAGSSTTIASDAFNCIAGDHLIFAVTLDSDIAPTSVTDTAGNTFQELTSCHIFDAANGQAVRAYYCANCLGNAANVITLGWAVAHASRGILGGQYSGLSGSPDRQDGQNEATPGTAADGCNSTPQTNAAQPAMCLGFCMNTGALGGLPTAGTGFTSRLAGINLGGGTQARYEDKRLTSLAAVETTFTAAANVAHTTIMAIFDEPGGGIANTDSYQTSDNYF